jgi:hypothetical protein
LRTIPGSFSYMNVDVLDNIYLLSAGNQLKKLNSNGDSMAVFNDVRKFGNPTYIDVTNPLKILTFYQHYYSVVVLDRLLIYRNNINLRKQNYFGVKAIATSYDNNIWLFDEQDMKLKKIDDDGKLLSESTDMRLMTDTAPSPSQLIDYDNRVFVYDHEQGFYVFDYYGALKTKLPFTHWTNTAISRDIIYGFENNKLHTYNLKTLLVKQYDLPGFANEYISIKAINGKLFLLKKDGLEIYNLD